jgi:non-heme chloroperoxidase
MIVFTPHNIIRGSVMGLGYYIRVKDNVKLFIEDVGEGHPILMIHGWPLNSNMFEYQMNILPEYGVRIIAPDLRGFGKSDRPFEGYNYNQMAVILKLLLIHYGLNNLHYLGFQWEGP